MLICSLLLYYPEEFRGIVRKMVKSVLFLFLVWSTSPLLMWRQGPHLEHPSALMWAPPQAVVWVLCSGALPPPPSLASVFMLLFVPLFSHHLSSTGASFGCFWPFLNAFCGNRGAQPCPAVRPLELAVSSEGSPGLATSSSPLLAPGHPHPEQWFSLHN